MNDEPPRIGGRIGRIALIAVATLVAIFGAGVIAGIIAAHVQRGGGTPSATLIMLLIAVAALVAIFGAGVIAGIIAAHIQRGGGTPSATLIMLLIGAGLLTAGAAFLAMRQVGAIAKEDGAATSRERRNRTVLIACGAIGGVMGAMLTLVGPTPFSAFTGDPLPPWIAVSFAAIVALLVPAISLYWHRHVVDEQEAAAYSKGALVGLYVFWIGAPTWWFLWRGGLAPAPDGVLIYFATIAVAGAVWMWAKYR